VSNINFDIWIFFVRESINIAKQLPTEGKVLYHLGFNSKVLQWSLTVHGWDSAPQAHSRVSNINFDIWIYFCLGGFTNIP
jgi:hypothetical protein